MLMKHLWSYRTPLRQTLMSSNVLSLSLVQLSKKFLCETRWLLSHLPLFTLNSTNGTDHSRKLSVRRGNPLGVLWVICWCGTWALKHPGALQQHRVTVTLSGFTVAGASATRPALPQRRLHVETITSRRSYNCICSDTWLDLFGSHFTFCTFFWSHVSPNSHFAFVLCPLLMSAENYRELHCDKTQSVWNTRSLK